MLGAATSQGVCRTRSEPRLSVTNVQRSLCISSKSKAGGKSAKTNTRELHQLPGKLKPLDAVSRTGALLSRGNPNRNYHCGKEPGEGAAGPLRAKRQIQEVGFWALVAAGEVCHLPAIDWAGGRE